MINQNNYYSLKWLIMSVLYASYNSVLLIPVLIAIKGYIKNNKSIKKLSISVSVITIILLMTIFGLLLSVNYNLELLEMPAVYAVSTNFSGIKGIYEIIILISIFTTAMSLGMGFLNNIAEKTNKYDLIRLLMCVTSVFFSKIGFANLVSSLYPLLGILGIIQIAQILRFKQ